MTYQVKNSAKLVDQSIHHIKSVNIQSWYQNRGMVKGTCQDNPDFEENGYDPAKITNEYTTSSYTTKTIKCFW